MTNTSAFPSIKTLYKIGGECVILTILIKMDEDEIQLNYLRVNSDEKGFM